ncbi:Magnesium transporter, partial [Trinorchestia longiramus]
MNSAVYKVLFVLGLIALIHGGYSAAQYRRFIRITEQEYSSLPMDVFVQWLVSLILTMYGVVHIAGEFREIRANIQLENKTWETAGNRPSFYIFSHRGRNLSPNYNTSD